MVERDKDVFQQFRQLGDEIHKRVVGNDDVIENIVIAIFAGGNILLESVPGMGKTVLTKTIAETMDMVFRRIQCTPDLKASDILGRVLYDDKTGEQRLEKGPIFTNLLLVDEINRAQPKTQSALLEAMEEKMVTIGGETHKLPQPFTVLATQNPVEQMGTFPLPEAQNDRFMFKSVMQYLTLDEEMLIVKSKTKDTGISKIFNPPEILIIREEIENSITISDSVLEYLVKVVEGTRARREVSTGGSPRATVVFTAAVKARAFFKGRDFVNAEDVKMLAFPILRHRILLNPDSKDFGITTDDIIAKVLARVEPPVD
ncbi:MAG: AAA domain-containing protein [Candidatus Altiarchaeales archaeon]|nr:AAA domain-containing protein [Candidatus Altiarchaeales archaeon]MBD3415566.1 AAA domain-containing protein [Candidatus Altiarchaeales archaeon]